MKSSLSRFTTAGAMLLAVAAPALAGVNGRTTTRCTAPLQIETDATGAEVYTLRLQGATPASYTDYGFDLSGKTTMAASATPTICRLASGFTWTRDDNDREFATAAPSDVEYVIVTLPPEAAGGAGRLLIDSGVQSDPTMDSGTWQYVGAGNGWTATPTLPGARGTKASAGGFNGAELQIGIVSELEPAGRAPLGTNCFIGGNAPRPGAAATGPNGLIVGYNVYRVAGTAAAPPALAAFMDNAAWQYYIDVTQFDTDMDAGGLTAPQRDQMPPVTATSDNAPDDLAGLQNSDGVFYTGEERLFFQDTPFLPSGAMRTFQGGASAAVENSGYWYAAQPVLSMGSLMNTAFNGIGFTNNGVFNGNHVIPVTVTGGSWQGIDLDLDGTPEFLNPQVQAGIQGLGLTNRSLPLLSQPVFADTATAALPADVQVTLNAEMTGSRVNIEFSLGLTSSDVRGFNVYRLGGAERALVNKTLIPSQAGEGSVYSVVDDAIGTARRVRREATFQYELEVVYGDHARTYGPFDITSAGREGGRRTR